MPNVVQTFDSPINSLFASEYQVETLPAVFSAVANKHTAVTKNTDGTWKVAGATDSIDGVTVTEVTAAGTFPVYVSGCFDVAVITVDSAHTTLAKVIAKATAPLFFKNVL